jgi:hypothetical protein
MEGEFYALVGRGGSISCCGVGELRNVERGFNKKIPHFLSTGKPLMRGGAIERGNLQTLPFIFFFFSVSPTSLGRRGSP